MCCHPLLPSCHLLLLLRPPQRLLCPHLLHFQQNYSLTCIRPHLHLSTSSTNTDLLDVNTSSPINQTTTTQTVNIPSYVLHRCEKSDPTLAWSHLANDPKLFFAGAPSAYEDDFVARILQRANREAKALGHPHRKVSFIPRGFISVTRVE